MTSNWRIYFWLAWMIFGGISAMLGANFQETWPQWRGHERNGTYEGQTWPQTINKDNLVESWSVTLGSSYSAPVTDLQRVYTTETLGSDQEQVKAYDRATGDLIWTQNWKGGMKVPFFAASNGSWIRSTPTLTDNKLIVMGMQERLLCLEADTGNILWQFNAPKELKTPEPSFGGVSSPMVANGAMYVQAGGGLIKLDVETGKLIWSSVLSEDAMNQSPFASPRIHDFGDSKQLVTLGRNSLSGIDPQNGELLWDQKVPAFRGMNILTPTFVGNSILTATYGGKAHLFTPNQSAPDKWNVTENWNQKFQGYMSSPVIVDNHAYLHGRSGRMVCLNMKTGDINWTSSESLGKYCSMMVQDDRILALSNDGKLRLLAANPEEYQVIDMMRVSDEDTWAHIAKADQQIFIRSLNTLTIWDWHSTELTSPSSARTVAISK